MTKGIPNKRYTGEFKCEVIETMRREHWSCMEAGKHFGVAHQRVCDWERIYLTEGREMLFVERRGRGSKGRPRKLPKEVEADLLAENQRLRAEVAYLKNYKPLEEYMPCKWDSLSEKDMLGGGLYASDHIL